MSGSGERFDDLDRLVSELNLLDPSDGGTANAVPDERAFVDTDFARLDSWLERVRNEDGGSDLLLVSGSPPIVRAPGRLLRISTEPLGSDEVENAVRASVREGLCTADVGGRLSTSAAGDAVCDRLEREE